MSANTTPAISTGQSSTNPFEVLGIGADADEAKVRARYLELVRQYPPDRDPAMFTKIRHAYESASDPVVMARRLIEATQSDPQPWAELLDEQSKRPPRLPHEMLLSLGNRSKSAKAPSEGTATPSPVSPDVTTPDTPSS